MRDGARHNNGEPGYGDIIICRISTGECKLAVEGPGDTGFPRIVSHVAYAG